MTTANHASGADSTPQFLALHAVRIKGTCDGATVAALSGLSEAEAVSALEAAGRDGDVELREGRRGGYRLTDAGRTTYAELLATDTSPPAVREALESAYEGFLPLNGRLKQVCTDWQLRNGQPNDHTDAAYDATVISALANLNGDIGAVLDGAAPRCARLRTYSRRFVDALTRVQGGDHSAFARPMAHSFHDAWMELHQDFLLSLGRERDEADGH